MSSDKGTFVSFEGMDGSGKSTVIDKSAQELASRGYNVETFPEFSDEYAGELLRQLYREDEFLSMGENTSRTQTGLVATDLLYFAESLIPAALESHDIVLKDRYDGTLYACQLQKMRDDYGKNEDQREFLEASESLAQLMPDHTFFLDVADEDVRYERLASRDGEVTDRRHEILEKRRPLYEEFQELDRVETVVNEQGKIEEVVESVSDKIEKMLED